MTKHEQQELEKKALDQLLSGKSLFGKDGAFAPMLKSFIEKVLQVEMGSHLSVSENNNVELFIISITIISMAVRVIS